jgi:nitroimidazol reductase NimA-like FMN-containing flavoprotein (pyridoxamine 5'-phosphate oxidase superfamily)
LVNYNSFDNVYYVVLRRCGEELLMVRVMRRDKQLLSKEDADAVMKRCTNGVLACIGDEDYPYAVPLSYVYFNDKVYFHSAENGHKIAAIMKNPRVSFAVVDEDKIVSEKFTTYFRSVIVFGKARIVVGDEGRGALRALVEKYSGDQPEEAKSKEISGCTQAYIVAIDIEHMTGKEAIEYVNAKRGNS